MDFARELDVASQIARKAGEIMHHYFDGDQGLEIKQDGSPVTAADKEINSMVIAELAKHFPDDGVIGEEESNTEYGMGRKWLCDPIDGTKAFVWGVPTSMFSLGLVVDGRPIVGVAYDPFLDRLYTAVKGQGSFMNGHKLSVSTNDIRGGTVSITSRVEELATGPSFVSKLSAKGAYFSTYSGAVHKMMIIACGKSVGYFEALVNPHDMAASEVIITEAGGMVTSMDGKQLDYSKPFKGAAASNGVAHQDLIEATS